MLEYNFNYPIRNKFCNQTFQWLGADNYENWKKNISDLSYKKEWPENCINYSFNNYGFRCNDFNFSKKYKHKIVFMGCSHTEGQGLDVESVWPYKLLNMINDELGENIPYWNIAVGGNGLDQQVRSLYQLIDSMQPNIIIILFPAPERREIYNNYDLFKGTPFWFKDSQLEQRKKYHEVFSDNKVILYNLGKNLAFLNLLSNKYNTKIICNHFGEKNDLYYLEYYKNFDFIKFKTEYKKIDLARDLMHYGRKSNQEFASKIFEEMFPTIKDILVNRNISANPRIT